MPKNRIDLSPLDRPPGCLRCGLEMPEYGICPPCQETAGKWIPMPAEEPEDGEQREFELC